MPSHNSKPLSKKALAYLSALTLLFSCAELILPRIFPFFRLGLANTVILLALDINFVSYLILSILKALAASLTGGTLFSPFFLISLLQSLASALCMRFLYKILSKKAISLYGISVAGSALSALVQIYLAALYIGRGSYALLGPMLIFNTVSGIITAFFCQKLGIKEMLISLENTTDSCEEKTDKEVYGVSFALQTLFAILIISLSIVIFFIKNLYILTACLILSLLAQGLSKRKIYILPHLSIWIFILFSALFTPNGKVLFKLWNFTLTEGALLMAVRKALTLSAVSALSQCAVSLKPSDKSLLGQSLNYYRIMNDRFRNSQGTILSRIINSLNIIQTINPTAQQIELSQTDEEFQ